MTDSLTILQDTIIEASKALTPPAYDEAGIHLSTSDLGNLAFWSTVIGIAIAVFAWLYFFRSDNKYKPFETLRKVHLGKVFGLVYFLGFIVYDVGMYTGEPWSLFGNSPMAILHAFGIFLLDSDVSAIHAPLHDNAWYMAAFSLVHILAALVSMAFVIKQFGYNIIATFWMWHEGTKYGSKATTTYLFWGLNDAAYNLATSIRLHHGLDDKDYRIIVIRTDSEDDGSSGRNAMERLFNFVKMRDKDVDRLQQLDCFTTSTFAHLPHRTLNETTDNGVSDDYQKKSFLTDAMRLKLLGRIINKVSNKQLHIFVLSENEQHNIRVSNYIQNDSLITQVAEQGLQVNIYCHARYNSIHRVIEDRRVTRGVKVKVIDSSQLAIQWLKEQESLHPVNFVDIEPDATVSSAFHALVIGFAEVGKDVVRFLYEFGSFVKLGSDAKHVERSDFHCDVVDKRMTDLAGQFMANAPEIMRHNKSAQDRLPWLTLHQMDCCSVEFYRRLVDEWLSTLNYVVIATENDDLNMAMAIRIFRLAVRHKDNLRNDDQQFAILVRIHDDPDGQLANIASYYNRLWEAEKCAGGRLKQSEVKAQGELSGRPIITLFGDESNTYTYDSIIGNKALEDAKRFHAGYKGTAEDADSKWQEMENECLPDEGYSASLGGLMSLRRKVAQNFANSRHQYTKATLAHKALGDADSQLLAQLTTMRKANTLTYEKPADMTQQTFDRLKAVLDTLAWTEHLRWNAAHEILGYRRADHKDEARLLHNCLCPWQDLPDDKTRSHDYNVVDLTQWNIMSDQTVNNNDYTSD